MCDLFYYMHLQRGKGKLIYVKNERKYAKKRLFI